MDMGKEDVVETFLPSTLCCVLSACFTNRTKSLTFFHSVLNGFALSAKMDFFISLAKRTLILEIGVSVPYLRHGAGVRGSGANEDRAEREDRHRVLGRLQSQRHHG